MSAVRGLAPRTTVWARRVERISPVRVLGSLIVLQWALVLGLALTVRHAGWIYYQGGDQLWYYTTGWLLAHGHFPQPGVGFLWCVLLAPIARVAGPNLVEAFPSIIVLQVVLLLPVALLAIYGIGKRIGGQLFGYWAAFLWLVVPLIGIRYTDAGYHQRFTEVLLPQGFGLTAMADWPTTVAALVSAYFVVRAIIDRTTLTPDAIAAGIAAGAAIAIKPATSLFLAGPALAFVIAREPRCAAFFTVGLAPAVLALTFVKWRGFGYVPLLHAHGGTHLAAGATGVVAAGGLTQYIPFHWSFFLQQLDQIREHFWSLRLIEWLVVAGGLALFIRSRRLGALVVGWFAAFVILKTASGRADFQGGSLLRVLMPAYPAFVLMLASLPFLLPGLGRRVPPPAVAPRRFLSVQARTTALVAAIIGTAVVPMIAYAASSPIRAVPDLPAAVLQAPPIPLDLDLGLTARRTPTSTTLTWQAQHPAGGPVFYHVFRRSAATPLFSCTAPPGAARCQLQLTDLGPTRATTFEDRSPGRQGADYYVGVSANWLDDITQGDVYALSKPAAR